LLVVVAIIAVLVSLLLPALSSARESAKRVVCGSGMSQAGRAFMGYAQDNNDKIPSLLYPVTGGKAAYSAPKYEFGQSDGLYLLVRNAKNPGYLPDPSVFMCPDDTIRAPYRKDRTGWAPMNSTDKNYKYTSHWYFFVSAEGKTYQELSNTNATGSWNGWQRYNVTSAQSNGNETSSSKACILYDQGYCSFINAGLPTFHPDGWNVLYLDGHVKFQSVDDEEYQAESGKIYKSALGQILFFDQRG
jgi:prepilin-type processing-associated H-X9-DG protein